MEELEVANMLDTPTELELAEGSYNLVAGHLCGKVHHIAGLIRPVCLATASIRLYT